MDLPVEVKEALNKAIKNAIKNANGEGGCIEEEIFLSKEQVMAIAGAADRINYTSSLESRIGKMREILIGTKLLSEENSIKEIINTPNLFIETLEDEVQEVQEFIKSILPFADYQSDYVKDKALEMLKETGFVKGIENYSRYLTDREPGEQPMTLLDYFPDDFLLFIDESHMTIPQVRGMYNGDRARKEILVEY